jgi:hypothetical protein
MCCGDGVCTGPRRGTGATGPPAPASGVGDNQCVDARELDAVVESLERLIDLARTVSFELLHSRSDPIARLMIESRTFATLTAELEPFEGSLLVMDELRRRHELVAADPQVREAARAQRNAQ